MRISRSMLLVATLFTAGASVAAASAGAAERMSDSDYLAAARCAGLIQGGKGDAGQLKARLDGERDNHEPFIVLNADQRRDEAMRQAQHAKGALAQKIAAERDGVCKAYVEAPQIAAR